MSDINTDIQYLPIDEKQLDEIIASIKRDYKNFDECEQMIPFEKAKSCFEVSKEYLESNKVDFQYLPQILIYGCDQSGRSGVIYIKPEKAGPVGSLADMIPAAVGSVIKHGFLPYVVVFISLAAACPVSDTSKVSKSISLFSMDCFLRYALSGFYQLDDAGNIDKKSFRTVWPSGVHPYFISFFKQAGKVSQAQNPGSGGSSSDGWPVINQDIDIKLS
jgi:hypothetical protein